jgi:hypothetical protein
MGKYSVKQKWSELRCFSNENKISFVLIAITLVGLIALFAFPQASLAVRKGTKASHAKWREIARKKAEKRLAENIPPNQPVFLPKTIDFDSAIFLAVIGGLLLSALSKKD